MTDTHFGIKNNSKVWCDYQMKFIDNTIIPLIKKLKKNDNVRIVHCGDVFDSKSSLNPYIVDRVINKFEELLEMCPVYIVAGNHDFYSMTEDSVCAINLLFRGLKGDLSYATRGFIGNSITKELMLPYFSTENDDMLKQIMSDIGFVPEIIYCHTDLEHLSSTAKECFKNSKIISGHIHIPCIHDNYYTIGSTYPLTFDAANAKRGVYVMDGNDVENMQFIENNDSIKFWRLYDKDIFNDDLISKFGDDDYIELYINKVNLIIDEYIIKINEVLKRFRNSVSIPNDVVTENAGSAPIDFNNFDIESLIERNIPEQLKEKFKIILKRVKDIS